MWKVLWALMLFTMTAKAIGDRWDNIVAHVIAFAAGPVLSNVINLQSMMAQFTDPLDVWLMWSAGFFYIGGLMPWSVRALEGHVAVWHACVLAGSGCVFAINYHQVARAEAMEMELEACVRRSLGG